MMFYGFAVSSIFYAYEDRNCNHPMPAQHHALCQEQSTALIVKNALEKVWGIKLMIQNMEWELPEGCRSLDGRERV